MSTWWEIAHKYLPAFWAGKTFTVYILLPRGAKSALTTSIRLSLTSFPKTNESLGEGQSRTTKAFVFTFTEKKWAMTSFLRIREKRESLLIYTLLWNGRHFLCDLIFCWIGNKALPYLKPSSWHFVLEKVTTKQYGTNEDMVKGSMILEAFFLLSLGLQWDELKKRPVVLINT